MLVFWDIDTQKDFINKDGALSIPNAEEIKPILKKLTDLAQDNDILIIGSMDTHFDDDEEFKKFPKHCLANTDGWERIKETETIDESVIQHKIGCFNKFMKYEHNELITLLKNEGKRITIEKQYIDVFKNPNIDFILEKLGVTEAIVYGVATELCVKAAVMGLLKRKIKVYLVIDGIRGINLKDQYQAISDMRAKGAQLITYLDVEKRIKNNNGK